LGIVALAALALYLPVWWALFANGYYDTRLDRVMLRQLWTYLPADLATLGLALAATVGWVRGRKWAAALGLLACGATAYSALQLSTAVAFGTLPRDPVSVLACAPYLVAALWLAALLWRPAT